jgi:hypothetical protein
MANITSDMLAVGVWHIGLFMVATRPQSGGRHVHTEGHQVGQREPCSPPAPSLLGGLE